MADMLVKLYPLPTAPGLEEALQEKGITIKKALAPDMSKIIAFTEANGHPSWADEIRVCFMNQPASVYIAVKDQEIIGFGCYETTARGFFGPTLVAASALVAMVGVTMICAPVSLPSVKKEAGMPSITRVARYSLLKSEAL